MIESICLDNRWQSVFGEMREVQSKKDKRRGCVFFLEAGDVGAGARIVVV